MMVWDVKKDLPLQNTNETLLRIALFNRILEFSRLEGINFACFIMGGVKLATTADFEIYINIKIKVKESVVTEFMDGLYSVPKNIVSVEVMFFPGKNSVTMDSLTFCLVFRCISKSVVVARLTPPMMKHAKLIPSSLENSRIRFNRAILNKFKFVFCSNRSLIKTQKVVRTLPPDVSLYLRPDRLRRVA
jgi:hypothetical protein